MKYRGLFFILLVVIYCADFICTAPVNGLEDDELHQSPPYYGKSAVPRMDGESEIEEAANAFFQEFKGRAIDKLFGLNKQTDFDFSKALIHTMPLKLQSHAINLYARKEDWEKVKFMLDHGANPELLAYSMQSALKHDWSIVVERLQRLGVPKPQVGPLNLEELNQKLESGEVDAFFAKRYRITLQFPIRSSDIETIDKLLVLTAIKGLSDVVQLLLAHGADIDNQDHSPLHWAAFHGFSETVDHLLAAGANWQRKSTERRITPLHLAAFMGHTNVVNYLLFVGADADVEDENGYTPLDLAISKSHSHVVKSLLDVGAVEGSKFKQSSRVRLTSPNIPF